MQKMKRRRRGNRKESRDEERNDSHSKNSNYVTYVREICKLVNILGVGLE
jgi:hypothetical protein